MNSCHTFMVEGSCNPCANEFTMHRLEEFVVMSSFLSILLMEYIDFEKEMKATCKSRWHLLSLMFIDLKWLGVVQLFKLHICW